MLNDCGNRKIKCSNICVGRGESQTYAVNQSLCRWRRRNVGVEKVECRWGGDFRVRRVCVTLNAAGIAVNVLPKSRSQRYLSSVPPTGRMWHKAFLRWVRAQGLNPDAPGIRKNASGPVGIPLKRGVRR